MRKIFRLDRLALVGSLVLLAAILFAVSRQAGFQPLLATWRDTDAVAFVLGILLMCAFQALAPTRLEVIAAAEKIHDVGYQSLLRIQLVSQFMANGAPISALADLAKAAMLKLRFDLPIGRSIRLVVYERVCAALGCVIVGLAATLGQLLVPTSTHIVELQLLVWAAGLLGGGAIIAIGSLHIRSGIALIDRIAGVLVMLGTLLRQPTVTGKLLLISLAQLIFFALTFLVLARGMHLPVSNAHAVLFAPFIFLISALPVFYQGWGGREAAVILMFGSTGVDSAHAVALSIAVGAATLASSLPGAVLWIMRPTMRKLVRQEIGTS